MKKSILFLILCMGTNVLASTKTILNYADFDVQVSLHDDRTNIAFTVSKAALTTKPGKAQQSMVNVSHINVFKNGRLVNCLPGQPCSKTIVEGTKIASKDISNNSNKPITITIVPTSDDTVNVSWK